MAVYRFRVSFEDNEDIYREIEIKSAQTFEDFHNTIVQSINFDNVHDASFFSSDYLWRKGDEITLKPANNDSSKHRNTEVATRLMNKCKMASLIEDPHQKFVYVYDPKASWTFLVELLKIVPDDIKITYPICAKTVGEAPKQYKTSNIAPVISDEDEFDDDDEPHGDDEAYVNAHSDDEVAVLEGEEGEDELAGETEEENADEDDEFGGDHEDQTEGLHDED
ncbi:MAG: hypothetical protein Q7W13_00845 [Bacteroidia bacterium]|nr:hypothetical protein [Bacteroidia bacterium]